VRQRSILDWIIHSGMWPRTSDSYSFSPKPISAGIRGEVIAAITADLATRYDCCPAASRIS
jgi:hypothetical protein